MEIELRSGYGFDIVFKAENVNVTEDVEERTYPVKEDGRLDFNKPPKRDILDSCVSQFVDVLDDIIYYREREFDSSKLIKRLFDKLPQIKQKETLSFLNKDYEFLED